MAARVVTGTKKLFKGVKRRILPKPSASTFYGPEKQQNKTDKPLTPTSDLEGSTGSSSPSSPTSPQKEAMINSFDSNIPDSPTSQEKEEMISSFDSGIEPSYNSLERKSSGNEDKVTDVSTSFSSDRDEMTGNREDEEIHDHKCDKEPEVKNKHEDTVTTRSCTIGTQTEERPKSSLKQAFDADDIAEDDFDLKIEDSDKPGNLPCDLRRKMFQRQRSCDEAAVITGLTVVTDIDEEEGEKYYIHRVIDVLNDGIASKLGIQFNDCILRLNQNDALQMTSEELENEFSFNAEIFNLVLAREDPDSECGIKTVSLCFSILRSFRHRTSCDRVSSTPQYEIDWHESLLEDDLEEDGEDECHIIARYLKKLATEHCILKSGSNYLYSTTRGVSIAPFKPDDQSFYFCLRNYRGKNIRDSLLCKYCILSPATSTSTVVAGRDGAVYVTGAEEVDGKLSDAAVDAERRLCADSSIFEIKAIMSGKYAFESTDQPGHFLCVHKGTCTIQAIKYYETDPRTHFSKMPMSISKNLACRRKFRV